MGLEERKVLERGRGCDAVPSEFQALLHTQFLTCCAMRRRGGHETHFGHPTKALSEATGSQGVHVIVRSTWSESSECPSIAHYVFVPRVRAM